MSSYCLLSSMGRGDGGSCEGEGLQAHPRVQMDAALILPSPSTGSTLPTPSRCPSSTSPSTSVATLSTATLELWRSVDAVIRRAWVVWRSDDARLHPRAINPQHELLLRAIPSNASTDGAEQARSTCTPTRAATSATKAERSKRAVGGDLADTTRGRYRPWYCELADVVE